MRAAQAISVDFKQSLHADVAACISEFHKLVRVAGHFDCASWMYIDPISGDILPEDRAAEAQRLHTQIFEQWLSLPLSAQSDEFTLYIRSLPADDRDLLLHLLRSQTGRDALAPPGTTPHARQLHSANLVVLLNLWK